jgi:quercetin dioxygenase-like cupin family protein
LRTVRAIACCILVQLNDAGEASKRATGESAMTQIQSTAPQGYVLSAGEGEHLAHFADAGEIFIHAGPATGSAGFALGTQQVRRGGGIPVHRHLHMDEAFYVLEGRGAFSLNDVSYSIAKGATIFIPRTAWHGFTTPGDDLLLLWVMTPPGLDGFFRETCNPPGVPPKQLTRDRINEIGRKYGTEYR